MKEKTFGEKIKKILKENGYTYKIKVYPKKEGWINSKGKKVYQDYEKVVIYAGRNIEKLAQRQSRKLVAFKNTKGEWEGDLEAVKEHGEEGDLLFKRYYNNKTEPIKYVLFSDFEWKDAEEDAKNKMLEVLKNWKFQETE